MSEGPARDGPGRRLATLPRAARRRRCSAHWSWRGQYSPRPVRIPRLGPFLVRGGEVVGEGATRPPGGAHAEVVAIERAGAAARGATLYVTLEPCCTQGRTPPCTDAILAAGIERVVVAMPDADPRVDGRAIAQLREAGLAVELGDGLTAARRHYEAYAHHRRTGRPFVTAKFAASLDGKIAATSGDSRWISSPETRAWSHVLRTQIDAILVGVSTVIVDDPELTARPKRRNGRCTPTAARCVGQPRPDLRRCACPPSAGAGAHRRADDERGVRPVAASDPRDGRDRGAPSRRRRVTSRLSRRCGSWRSDTASSPCWSRAAARCTARCSTADSSTKSLRSSHR